MPSIDKRNLVAQWAFDTRPVLLRFHLWLEDVEVERSQAEPVSAYTFTPRGIARCLAVTSAATASENTRVRFGLPRSSTLPSGNVTFVIAIGVLRMPPEASVE